MPSTRLIFGCGYLGLRVGQLWRDAGDEVLAATRSEERAWELRTKHGFRTLVVDVAEMVIDELPRADTLLYAVGYDRSSGNSIEDVYAGGLRNVLAMIPSNVRRAIYVSTTGVYGPAKGDWVDESTPPDPHRDGGRASLEAEQVLARRHLGRRSAILRLAGIYGPGRVPHLDKLRAGEPLPVPRDGWLNLIHVDDAARIVVAADNWLAARQAADGPHVFCISDGAPVKRDDYYRTAAQLLGAPTPAFTAPPPDSPAAARAGANRRIRNDKMRATFSLALSFPTYREGLQSILSGA